MRKYVVLLWAAAWTLAARESRAEREPVFPIDVAVTSDEGTPVVDHRWIEDEVRAAEHVFGPLGAHLRVEREHPLGADLARIEDPRMRDRFAPLVSAHRVQVFIVRSLRDNVQVGLYRGGVTWDSIPSAQNGPSRRFIILAATAAPSSLAHELGHFFGLQPHSTVKNNLMSYDRDDALVFLDASQQAIVKGTARALRTSGALSVIDWVER